MKKSDHRSIVSKMETDHEKIFKEHKKKIEEIESKLRISETEALCNRSRLKNLCADSANYSNKISYLEKSLDASNRRAENLCAQSENLIELLMEIMDDTQTSMFLKRKVQIILRKYGYDLPVYSEYKKKRRKRGLEL